MNVKRLYVAGPMTGLPDFNMPAFFEAQRTLEKFGYEVRNPGRHGSDEGKTWADYMRLGIADVLAVEGVAVLLGWESSKGARLEVHIAAELGLPIKGVSAWVGESVKA